MYAVQFSHNMQTATITYICAPSSTELSHRILALIVAFDISVTIA